MLLRALLFVWGMLLAHPAAWAEEFTLEYEFAGHKLVLEPPEGYCYFDPDIPEESKLMDEFFEFDRKLDRATLMIYVECDRIARIRKGIPTPLTNFGRVGTHRATMDHGQSMDMTRAQYLEMLDGEVNLFGMKGIYKQSDVQLRELFPHLSKVYDRKEEFHDGVVHRDAQGLHLRTFTHYDPSLEGINATDITSATVINGIKLFINFKASDPERNQGDAALQWQIRFVEKLILMNEQGE